MSLVEINLTSNDVILGVRGDRASVSGLSKIRRAGGAVDRRRRRFAIAA